MWGVSDDLECPGTRLCGTLGDDLACESWICFNYVICGVLKHFDDSSLLRFLLDREAESEESVGGNYVAKGTDDLEVLRVRHLDLVVCCALRGVTEILDRGEKR
jgi:hypothetical protein